MLVLSRMKNEKIRIADDITLVVVEIRGDKVRLASTPRPKRPSTAKKSGWQSTENIPVRNSHLGRVPPLMAWSYQGHETPRVISRTPPP